MFKRYNGDLSNDFGNLVSRSVAMIDKYRSGVVPAKPVNLNGGKDFEKLWEDTKEASVNLFKNFSYSEYLVKIWDFINIANKYIEDSKPWELAKSTGDTEAQKLDGVLYNLAESIRLSALFVFPFMPSTCQRIFRQLGIDKNIEEMSFEADGKWGAFTGGTTVGKREILFPRIEENTIDKDG
jgi:methionyl-tRNA synthetase